MIDPVVREGVLQKRNEWYWKQERHFVLYLNGEVKYFQNEADQKGTIVMNKNTKINRTSKTSFEITLDKRTYYLFAEEIQVDLWIHDL